MTVIGLLQERGLVDGIGEQGHFLERADVPVVAANLDTLASTGLPIYISELDLNFTDDARQANVMRDLFPVFWDHPSVAGITHWGFRQGATWRPNAYLLRSDGTTRPAFDWISCYIGGGGDTCTVPEYVPAGWTGNEFGLTLEAEEYDDGEGVAALGNVIAFTDGGDWIAFKGVNFQQGWDTFWVNYSKGNTAAGSISIHIDDRESPAVLTLDLPPTGGWNTPDMLEEAWMSLTGTHDVYINFHAVPGEGIANIDSVRFGKPQPTSGPNLVVDGGFETGIAGWSSWNGSALSASTSAGAQRRTESACNQPARRQPVRRLQPHQRGPGQHHLRRECLGIPYRRSKRHRAIGGEDRMHQRRLVPLAAEQHGRGPEHLDTALRQPRHPCRMHRVRCGHLLRGDLARLRCLRRRRQRDTAEQQSRRRRRL